MSFPSPGSVQTTRDSFVVVLYVRINYKKKKITNISNYKFVGMAFLRSKSRLCKMLSPKVLDYRKYSLNSG